MQPHPSEQYQLSTLVKKIVVLLAVAVFLVVAMRTALLVANLRTQQRSESLLASLLQLQVGTTQLSDAKPLLESYGAKELPRGNCFEPSIGYGILESNKFIDSLGTQHPFLLKLGLRPVGTTATLSFAGGRLCQYKYSASALITGAQLPQKDKSLNSAELIELRASTTVFPGQLGQRPDDENYQIRYFRSLLSGVGSAGWTVGLDVNVASNAKQSDLDRGRAFDLSCFSSFGQCRTLCQLLPFASRDAIQRSEHQELSIPEDEIDLVTCTNTRR